MDKKIIGNWGEGIATAYLKRKGYEILERNWRHHHKEVDIIAFKGKVVGFEIKTRKNNLDLPQTILKPCQLSRLRASLCAYCLKRGFNYSDSRLDLIVIDYAKHPSIKLNHYSDI